MLRERIIKTASALYASHGIKGISMSEIAAKLRISKKTLYVEFESKEQLLAACTEYEITRISLALKEVRLNAEFALESILVTWVDLCRYHASFCPAFYRDIKRFPEAAKRWVVFLQQCKDNSVTDFETGVYEGDFVSDQNYELITSIFIDQVTCMKPDYQLSIILNVLRGVCTEQGVGRLAELTDSGGKHQYII